MDISIFSSVSKYPIPEFENRDWLDKTTLTVAKCWKEKQKNYRHRNLKVKNAAFRSCVFCGSAADSREHVFAKRLCARAGAKKYLVAVGLFVEGKGHSIRNRNLIEGVLVRHVCAKCNNTWMNDLEAWFESRLGFLIEPQWPKLALAMIKELKAERSRLAQWLMKTAVMYSKASVQGDHRVEFSTDVTRKIKDGTLPENCWVDLAYSKSLFAVGAGISRIFNVINAGQPPQHKVLNSGDGFKFIVQFNHLLLRLGQVPNANVTYQSQRGECPVRLYPTPLRIPNNFEYTDMMQFERSVILETWQGCPGNIK
jgi:hypothetical protein